MKNRFKLLVLVLAILAMIAVVASCDFGGGGDDTTATTATTTAPAGGQIPQEDLDKISFKNLPDTIPYDGNPLNSSDVGVGKPSYLNASYKFEKINLADGSVIADLGSTYPTDVGTYKITATFSWRDGAEEMYPGAELPAAVSDTFKIVAGDANRASAFGVKALNLFYYPTMNYDPTAATGAEQFTTGTLPKNVTIAGATIEKLASADATSGTAVAGAKITEAGIYKVTINYAQNGENWSASSLAGKSAVITVIECPNQVLRNDNVVVDGLLGDEYTGSAVLTGKKQLYTQTSSVYTLTPDENEQIVDPMEFIPMLSINHGSQAGEKSEGSKLDVSVHVVWGANGTKGDYVYVAVVVEDPTDCMRSEEYTRALNPWVNDGIEVYYNFGGYSAPVVKKNASGSYGETYPTYSAVVNDSAARPGADPTAVDLQKSFYWDDIEFASTRVPNGNGGVTYICEYAFPAKSEGDNGEAVGPQFAKTAGEALTAGEFLFFGFQFNDLVALDTVQNPLTGAGTVGDAGYKYDATFPSGAKYPNYANDFKLTMTKDGDWDKFESALNVYMACYGNRSAWYLMHDQGGPSYFQLSADAVQ